MKNLLVFILSLSFFLSADSYAGVTSSTSANHRIRQIENNGKILLHAVDETKGVIFFDIIMVRNHGAHSRFTLEGIISNPVEPTVYPSLRLISRCAALPEYYFRPIALKLIFPQHYFW